MTRTVNRHAPALGRSLAVLSCGHDIDGEDVFPLPTVGSEAECWDCWWLSCGAREHNRQQNRKARGLPRD